MIISYAIPVCNEWMELEYLLNYLFKHKREQDEIVVQCDKGNTTPSVYQVLQTFNSYSNFKVVEFPLNGDFATFKNNLKDHCSGDYVFQIDADEYPDEYLMSMVETIIKMNDSVDIFWIPRINKVNGLTQEHINKWGWNVDQDGRVNFPDYQCRILKNVKRIKWKNKVHEQLTGYKTHSQLPANDEFCLVHIKDIKRQEKQNNLYNSISMTLQTKDFAQDFYKLLDKFKRGEHFAFTRFSDGELRIMQNTELKLADDHNIVLGQKNPSRYAPENHKHFIPEKHSFYRDKLMEAYRFKKHNYYVGLSCRCCVGNQDFQQMLDWYEGDTNSEFLTWSNLMLNDNYKRYKQEFIPEYSKKKIVIVCNENAKIENLPFPIVKDFRVGKNCFINDYGLIQTIKDWIKSDNITDHVFLFSAASLSELLIHQLFEFSDQNTYIDIGTTLNNYLDIDKNRGYLLGSTSNKVCVW